MSRDHLLPRWLRVLTRQRIPWLCIVLTVLLIVVCLVFFRPTRIAKLASAFQLLLFAMLCVAVIVMRESHIPSYDPGYRAPWYPYLPIAGILLPLLFISQMGWLPVLFSGALIGLGAAWFYAYARARVARAGAILHVLERVSRPGSGERGSEALETPRELYPPLEVEPYEAVIARAEVLDLRGGASFEHVTRRAAAGLAEHLPRTAAEIAGTFLQGTAIGTTVVTQGVALPHFRLRGLTAPVLLAVRIRDGVPAETYDPFGGRQTQEHPLHAVFYLVSPEELPALHLQVLASLAQQVETPGFLARWLAAPDEPALKAALLHEERFLTLELQLGGPGAELIDGRLRDLPIPSGCLVALVRRGEETFVPAGYTVLRVGDRLTVIGDPEGLARLRG
jgi:mannitol/fructose-specific phosphotransferase system IIA component (Ntr-type)